jgi:hypothetical protein
MRGRRLFLLGATAVWLTILALIVKMSLDRLSAPSWGNQIGESRSEEIAGPVQVGQTFTAPYPGLYRIEVALDPNAVQSSHPVTFQLKTEPSAADALATSEFSTADVRKDVPFSFEFAPVRDSQGRTFIFLLESPEAEPGDALTAYYGPDAILRGASAYSNGQAVSGNLEFRTFYTMRTRDKVGLLLARMADGRPYLFGTEVFYIGLAVAYAVALGIFLWQIAQAILEDTGS